MRTRVVVLSCLVVSVLVMAVAAGLGPSALVPPLGSHGPFASISAHPSRYLVTLVAWSAVLIGAAGVVIGLWTSRVRAALDPRTLLLAGAVFAAAYALMPPIGSTDILDYALYGHMVHIGKNPYVVSAVQMRELGDPVAKFAPQYWQYQLDVYGPVATAVQWMAGWIGGASMASIVGVLKWINALAFVGTAFFIDRLAGPDPVRRVRAALLWTVNPVMLLWLVGSGHTDLIAVLPMVAGIYVLSRARGRWPMLVLAGVLAGVGVAVKVSFLFPALGLVLALRHSTAERRRVRDYRFGEVAAIGAGVVVTTGVAYLIAGKPAVKALSGRLGRISGDFLPFPHALLHHPTAYSVWIAALTLVCLVVLWFRYPGTGTTPGGLDLRPALVLAVATTIVGPIQYPWYDAIFMSLLAITLASPVDLWLFARGLLLTICILPGVYRSSLRLNEGLRWVLVTYLVAFAIFCLFGFRSRPAPTPAEGDPKNPDDAQSDQNDRHQVQRR